jgi:uncharacterized protein (DUF2225 family)
MEGKSDVVSFLKVFRFFLLSCRFPDLDPETYDVTSSIKDHFLAMFPYDMNNIKSIQSTTSLYHRFITWIKEKLKLTDDRESDSRLLSVPLIKERSSLLQQNHNHLLSSLYCKLENCPVLKKDLI